MGSKDQQAVQSRHGSQTETATRCERNNQSAKPKIETNTREHSCHFGVFRIKRLLMRATPARKILKRTTRSVKLILNVHEYYIQIQTQTGGVKIRPKTVRELGEPRVDTNRVTFPFKLRRHTIHSWIENTDVKIRKQMLIVTYD